MQLTIGEWLKKYVNKTLTPEDETSMSYPPGIGKTLGFELVEIGEATATMAMKTDPAIHGNPMGTVHGGVLCDIADAAIGSAHVTTLAEGESFTSIDLRINFFRPLWKDEIRATAKAIQLGKTVSFYTCEITRADGKLVAVVSSSVMTLRGDKAKGR
ncbi:MAG TPA: PaaI family thioesterase [Candidatus Angelobacter sp.]|nr:PaaI family thioesterase [Candidatus Angelobacter sp.]